MKQPAGTWRDAPVEGKPAQSWRDAPVAQDLDPSVTMGVYPKAEPPGQEGPGLVRSVSDTAARVFMGEGRMQYPDMPDIGSLNDMRLGNPIEKLPMGSRAALTAGVSASSDPKQVADIALKHLPGAALRSDDKGNPIIDWQGGSLYVAKPGFRQQDAARIAGQGLAYAGATGLGQAAGGGLISRILASLFTNAGTSLLLDKGSEMAGSEQGASLPRAILAGGGGALAAQLTPVVNTAVRTLGRRNVMGPDGRLLPEASALLRREGIELSDDQARVFARMVADSVDPEDAARYAQSQSLPVPVPETRGTVTQNPSTQMFENQALDGVYGDAAHDLARGAQARQQEALRANVPAIQARLSGGQQRVAERGQGGAIAQSELQASKDVTKQAVSRAYDTAKANPAILSGDDVSRAVSRITESAQPYYAHSPQAQAQGEALRGLADRGLVTPEQLFDWRRQTSKLMRSAPDETQRGALREMITSFDSNIDDLVRNSLIAGDEDAARLWSKAVAARRRMGKRFGNEGGDKSNDLIGQLLEKEYKGRSYQLKVPPEGASNLIFGASNLGFVGKPQLARDLMRLRDRLGRNSAGWQGIREEAFLRFANQAEGALNGSARMFSGAKGLKAWEDAMTKNGPVMRTLFSEPEANLIGNFWRTAARVTNPVRGGRNFSGTSQGLADIMKRMYDGLFIGEKGKSVLSRLLPKVHGYAQDAVQTRRIAESVSGRASVVPLRQAVPDGVVGSVGAQAGREGGNKLSRQPNQ